MLSFIFWNGKQLKSKELSDKQMRVLQIIWYGRNIEENYIDRAHLSSMIQYGCSFKIYISFTSRTAPHQRTASSVMTHHFDNSVINNSLTPWNIVDTDESRFFTEQASTCLIGTGYSLIDNTFIVQSQNVVNRESPVKPSR